MNDRDRKLKLRYVVILAGILLVFAYLASGLVSLQLDNSEEYVEDAEGQKTLTIKLRGKRGNIVDADSVILAQDQWIYNVTFYKDAAANSKAEYSRFTASIIDTIGIIERNGYHLENNVDLPGYYLYVEYASGEYVSISAEGNAADTCIFDMVALMDYAAQIELYPGWN